MKVIVRKLFIYRLYNNSLAVKPFALRRVEQKAVNKFCGLLYVLKVRGKDRNETA